MTKSDPSSLKNIRSACLNLEQAIAEFEQISECDEQEIAERQAKLELLQKIKKQLESFG